MTLALLLARPAAASDAFLDNMHRAEGRKLSDEERLEYYNRAIRTWKPDNGNALLAHCHFRRGETYFHRYQFPEAEPDLTRALDLDPRNGKAYLLRGRLRDRAGRHAAAVKDLLEAEALLPDDLEARLALGEAQRKAGQLDAALGTYARVAGQMPSDFRPVLGVARVRMASKDWTKALETLAAAEALSSGREPDVHAEGAVCEAAQGRLEKSLARYDKALPLHEGRLQELERSLAHPIVSTEAQEAAARAYFGRGRVREFLAQIARAVEDYERACALGHEEACRKAEALAGRAQAKPAKPKRAPREEPAPEPPKAKRKRLPRPKSDSGERIYAN